MAFWWRRLILAAVLCRAKPQQIPVTYGSVVRIENSGNGARLYSTTILWGSTSAQQVVTGAATKSPSYDESSTLWYVRGAPQIAKTGNIHPAFMSPALVGQQAKEGTSFIKSPDAGSHVNCSDIIVLEHVDTLKNLHTHKVESALSRKWEVSAFGSDGVGDAGDFWQVLCQQETWTYEISVELQHVDTRAKLYTNNNHRFTERFCPRCPIVGHSEVVAWSSASAKDSQWVARPILKVNKDQDSDEWDFDEDTDDRDEL